MIKGITPLQNEVTKTLSSKFKDADINFINNSLIEEKVKDNKDNKDIKDNKDKKDKKDLLIDIDDNYYCFNPSKILRKIEPYLIKKFKGDAK